MVKEIGIEQISVRDGGIIVGFKAKTDNGNVGMNVAFEIRKEIAIAAALDTLEDAINSALVNTLAIGPEISPVKDPAVGATA